MRLRRSLLALAAVCVGLVAAGCGGLIQGDASKLVLNLGQAPSGFHVLSQGTYANAAVAQAFGISASQVGGAMGRLTGYRVTFVRNVTTANLKQGAAQIDSVVSLYQGAVAAGNALTFEIKANKQRVKGLQALSLGSVGQQSFAFAYNQVETQAKVTVRYVNVYWRERNALAAVSVIGAQGSFADSAAMQLARAQDAVLKKAS